ncbi:Acyl-CoA synthetase (AMP-forming)/AMP-acid ligase II [Sinosporangium album]|uniref:Acyl-CoA synthetase (AMP-forming)/AMP-acid ligase II n=1 Tax=Sinosporangium album TaxID=504805 RepID=A0A1G8B7A9_9ACTN|nr:AMP-binding protein [Sinosporangium album]SDH29045.1 Acyl-CoA synthetase (AMP-forming)/AMP-acid ligase II [Sinosporangium album]
MYPALIAAERPEATAYVMAGTGHTLTYRHLDEQSNRLAHLLRAHGIGPGGSVILIAENRVEWPIVMAAGMRAGLYVTPVNWHLTEIELRGMLAEALSAGAPAAVITSADRAGTVLSALSALGALPGPAGPAGLPGPYGDGRKPLGLCLDGAAGPLASFHDAIDGRPATPVADELLGARVLYSGGTTGRPKAFRQRLLGVHPADAPPRHAGLTARLAIDADTVFLSPAPNYHAAPFTFQLLTLGLGGTVVCMERFDAQAALEAIERYGVSHSQWVPTMLSRLLALPADARGRHDLSGHRVAWTSGGPCSHELKKGVMSWWGPILHEYYGASEGYGHTYVSPEEALVRPGTVGRALSGGVHITDENGVEVGPHTVGKIWFSGGGAYRNADDDAVGVDPHGRRSVGDLGRLDEDGFLYLVGREGHTIVTGGVNVYPTEVEHALMLHPSVADAAVFGVPDPEFGERVKAVVQLRDPGRDGEPRAELVDFCRTRLAGFKVPREIEFVDRLPRLPTGKLNKGVLMDAGAAAVHMSAPRFEVLHALRVKGMADVSAVGALSGLGEEQASRHLAALAQEGLVTLRERPRAMAALTAAGREEHLRLLAEEVGEQAVKALEADYERFLPINRQFKRVCTSWQIRDDTSEPNDHGDAGYDAGVVERLAVVHADLLDVLDSSAGTLPRFRRYARRLTDALARVRAGETAAFARPLADSYHDIWMELHQDLLLALRRERSARDE